jgi:hypothetical protein
VSYVGTIDLSALMGCTLPLQIDGIAWNEDPLVVQDVGRTATTVKAEGVGYLDSADLITLASDIANLETTSRVSGVDLTITGISGAVLHRLRASDCYEGGPHIAFAVLDADGGLYRRVKFTVTAKCHFAQLLHNWRIKIATGIDGLSVITQQGSLQPAAASVLFSSTVLPAFQAAYPPAQYLITFDVDYPFGQQTSEGGQNTTITDETTRYQITGRQLASALPGGGGSAVVVEGEVIQRSSRDDQQRKTIITEYELQLKPNTGDYTSLVNALRPAQGTAGSTMLVGESVTFSSIKAWKLRVAFTQLGSADGDGLLNYTQVVTYTPGDTSYEIYTYPGTFPIAVARPTTFSKLTQTGSQTGLGEFYSAPDPLMTTFDNPPVLKYTDINNYEKRTEWEYSFIDVDNAADLTTILPSIQRPNPVTQTGVV